MSSNSISANILPRYLEKHKRYVPVWLFVFVITGYPAAALLSVIMNLDSTSVSIAYRMLVIFFSIWLILTSRNPERHRGGSLLAIFGICYFARLVWDWSIAQVPGSADALVFFLAVVIIPTVALWRGANSLRGLEVERLLFIFGSLICIMALGIDILGIAPERSTTDMMKRLSYDNLNPISLGHSAVSTLIAVICLISRGLRPWIFLIVISGGIVPRCFA